MEPLRKWVYWALKKSERYTKTDMVYLTKGSFWLVLGQGIYAFTSFFLAIAFARFISPGDYGTYKFVIAVFGILSITTASGINQALVQAIARGIEGSFKDALSLRIRYGLLGALGSIALSLYYLLQGNSYLALCFLVVTPFVPLIDSFTLYLSIWSGKKMFGPLTSYASITHVLSSLSLITALFFTDNIVVLLFVYFSSVLLLRLFFHTLTLRQSLLNNEKDPETISTGIHFSVMNIFPLIAQQLDKILLFHYLGAAEVAVYSFATAIPDQIKAMLKGLQTIIIPKFAQQETHEVGKSISTKIIPFIGILSVISLLYFLTAKYIYLLFFPLYESSVIYSQLYGISIIGLAFILPHSLLQAKLATRELYQFNIVRSIIQIVLLFIGAYTAGIWGVIIARVLGEFFNFGILLFLSKMYQKKSSLGELAE